MSNRFFTDPGDMYIVVKVPHQMPATASSHRDERDALAFYEDSAASSGGAFETWIHHGDVRERSGADFDVWDADDATRGEIVWEWVEDKFASLYRWTLAEAREKLAWLDTPNGGKGQKMHQHAAVAAILRQYSLAQFQADVQVTFGDTVRLTIGDDSRDETPELLEDEWGAWEDVDGFFELKKLHEKWLADESDSAVCSITAS